LTGAGAAGLDDRRATLVAAGLVGAVVLVLGFGSGIGSVLSRDASDHPAGGGRDLGTAVQPDDVGRRISSTTGALTDTTAMPSMTSMTSMTSTSPTTTPTTVTSTTVTPTTTGAAPTCPSGGAAAALTPFLVHLDKAHLEESPGEQVAQALDLDQYVQTHTVLVEDMLVPTVAAVTGDGCAG
jgi:hypothetical protein